jgi:hypothetical protein
MRATVTILSIIIASLFISGCQSVHQEDLVSWEGAPVSALDAHPFFLTLPMVRTVTADGTEIRNYVNGRNIGSCGGGGSVYGGTVDMATYRQFSSCTSPFAACNNIFYIKNGRIIRYTPTGSGGTHCMTNEQLRPGFTGPANFT